jgi:Tfp pilus assembly protein PilF
MKYTRKIILSFFCFYLCIFSYVFSENEEVSGVEEYVMDEDIERGLDYVNEDMADQAIEQFEIAIEKNPDNAQAHCFLGIEIYKKAVKAQDVELLKEAVGELDRAIKIDPDFGIAHDVIAFAYYILGDFHSAKRHHEKAKDLGIENPVLERKLETAFEMLEKKQSLQTQE